MQALIHRTRAAYAEQFGRAPTGVAVAPGRVNIIGEHTDYNSGLVLPIAIDRYIAVAFEPTESAKIEIWSEHSGESNRILLPVDPSSREGFPTWVRYAAGMAWALEQAGHGCPGAELAVCSSLPIGAGVSSSAAFEIAVGTAIAATATIQLDPSEMALLAHKSDHEFVGIPSGIMDQFASACCVEDHALFLDCRDRSFEHVPLGTEIAFVVIDTGKRRELVASEYAERVASCLRAVEILKTAFPDVTSLRDVNRDQLRSVKHRMDDRTYRRARHVVTEMSRPSEMVKFLAADDWTAAGRLMVESHESLATDYEVSCTELDAAVEIAGSHPACFGARLTGAGFGGCAIAFCSRSAVDEVATYIEDRYRRRFEKGSAYGVRASNGVCIVN